MPSLRTKHAGAFATLAGRLRGAAPAAASTATRALRATPAAAVHASAPTLAASTASAASAARAAHPNPVDAHVPGFLSRDARLRGVEGKLQARGASSPSRERTLERVQDQRQDLHRKLHASAGSSYETHVEPHLRPGREVAIRPGGMSHADEQELTTRTLMPRRGDAASRSARMMPALSTAAYERQALQRGAQDPAMRAVAQTIQGQRDRAASIPRAIAPKLGRLKTSFLGGALKSYGALAQTDPVKALARAHAADQALRGALYGGAIGGLGGAALSRPGDEENMALRGALAGALGGGGYGAYAGHRDASGLLATPEGLKALAGRLAALKGAGPGLTQAFTA